jgi:hypothetical protein
VKRHWIAIFSLFVLANGSLGHAAGRTLEDRRRELEAGLQKRLDSVDKQLKELHRSAGKEGLEARGKLDRLKASSKTAWKDLRNGVEKAIKDLESAVKEPEKKKSKYYRL